MTRRLRWSETDYLRYRERGRRPSVRTKRKRKNGMPQEILFQAMEAEWPGRFEAEATGLVPGRRFSADICDRRHRGIVECDGWNFHGRFKAAFLRDREKDYHLTIQGWRVLRIPAGLVIKDMPAAMERIRRFVLVLDRDRSGAQGVNRRRDMRAASRDSQGRNLAARATGISGFHGGEDVNDPVRGKAGR